MNDLITERYMHLAHIDTVHAKRSLNVLSNVDFFSAECVVGKLDIVLPDWVCRVCWKGCI